MNKHVVNVAFIRAIQGKRSEVVEAILNNIGAIRKEPGCLQYDAHVAVNDDHVFILIERWASPADAKRHKTAWSLHKLLGAIKGIVIGMPDSTRVTATQLE